MKAAGYSTEYNDYAQGNHWLFASESNPVDLSEAADSKVSTLVDLPFDHIGSQQAIHIFILSME